MFEEFRRFAMREPSRPAIGVINGAAFGAMVMPLVKRRHYAGDRSDYWRARDRCKRVSLTRIRRSKVQRWDGDQISAGSLIF